MTSNAGQLLWSGIVADGRAAAVVERLLAADRHSGWASGPCRPRMPPTTRSSTTTAPSGHDTALIAEGLRRYGHRQPASRLAFGLLDAAAAFAWRLPEVFAGYPRAETGMPVEYPTACRPQAWAAGTPPLAIRTLLGLDVRDGRLQVEPTLPTGCGSCAWTTSRSEAAERLPNLHATDSTRARRRPRPSTGW